VLEQLWLVERNVELARFYQALIQAAGAFVHLQKNFEQPSHAKHGRRLQPATRLFALALRNLEDLPDEYHALDLVQFRKLLLRYRDAIIAVDFKNNPGRRRPRLVWPWFSGSCRGTPNAAQLAYMERYLRLRRADGWVEAAVSVARPSTRHAWEHRHVACAPRGFLTRCR